MIGEQGEEAVTCQRVLGGEKAAGDALAPLPHGPKALPLPNSSNLRLCGGPEAGPLGWLPLLFSPGVKANFLPTCSDPELLAWLFFVPRIEPGVRWRADGPGRPWV